MATTVVQGGLRPPGSMSVPLGREVVVAPRRHDAAVRLDDVEVQELVRQQAARAHAPLFAPDSAGAEWAPGLLPLPDELVVTKAAAGGFSRTDLHQALAARGVDHATLQRASLAALADRFADVLTTDEILALPLGP